MREVCLLVASFCFWFTKKKKKIYLNIFLNKKITLHNTCGSLIAQLQFSTGLWALPFARTESWATMDGVFESLSLYFSPSNFVWEQSFDLSDIFFFNIFIHVSIALMNSIMSTRIGDKNDDRKIIKKVGKEREGNNCVVQ